MKAATKQTPLRLGVLKLTDSAPMIAAYELGFFADEGLDATVSVEPSWANVADKLAHGALDAASITPPLAIAVSLGLRGPARRLIVPYALSLGGNSITLTGTLAEEVKAKAKGASTLEALAAALRRMTTKPKLAVVHDYSTHNLQLRYWLATAGIEADRDVEIVVTPPARMVEALASGRIAGFCAGAPWGDLAARAGAGGNVLSCDQIWRHAPEKALGLREDWAEANPEATRGLLRALYRAARFCDAPENSPYVAAMLGRRAYLDVEPHAILSTLPGALGARSPSVFHRHAATYPWRSHALWMHEQMSRWGLIGAETETRAQAVAIYRPDIYATALAAIGAPIPISDMKKEGGHTGSWAVDASPSPIAMESDLFCDGATF